MQSDHAQLIISAEQLARQYLHVLPRRLNHTHGVVRRAKQLTDGMTLWQQSILVAAAWLHDIGYSPDLAHTGFHPIDGAFFLSGIPDFPPEVVSLVAYHSGARYEAVERRLLDQLAVYAKPEPSLLNLLTTADITTSPDGHPVDPAERIAEILTRYPADHPVHRTVSKSGPKLIAIAREVLGSQR